MNCLRPTALGLTNIVIMACLCAVLTSCKSPDSTKLVAPPDPTIIDGTKAGGTGGGGTGMPNVSSEGARADGVGSGGGGDVVVCYNAEGEIVDMESFDIWASWFTYNLTFDRAPLGKNSDVGQKDVSYVEIVSSKLRRLAELDPFFSGKLRSISNGFSPEEIAKGKNIHVVPFIPLNGDGGAVLVPETLDGCYRVAHERMFWQFDDPKAHQYGYQLVERLWRRAPEKVKAAVVLHESIWKAERDMFNPKLSINTQYYNSVLNSNEFAKYSVGHYRQMLKDLADPIGGEWLAQPTFSIKHLEFEFYARTFVNVRDEIGVYVTNSAVATTPYYVSGTLVGIEYIDIDGTQVAISSFFGLDNKDRPKAACSARPQSVQMVGETVEFTRGDLIEFGYSSGKLFVERVLRKSPVCQDQ